MLRLLLGANRALVTSIVSKLIAKCFRKNLGCTTAKVDCKDFTIMDGHSEGRVLVHLNCDLDVSKEELLRLLDNKIGEAE